MQDRIAHAKSYPFPAPDHCFLYEDGGWRPLAGEAFETDARVPVLAAGSNQSPEQIHRKYGELPDIGAIPAQRGRLHDFDVVYAAHLTRYGSVPATFQRSPGTAVTVFMLWLDETQLARMHETERNYTYDHLTGIHIALDSGGSLGAAYAYSAKCGCLNHGGDCVSLHEIAAEGRKFTALTQPDMLGVVRDRLAPGAELDSFVGQHVTDRAVQLARSRAMGSDALPAAFPRNTLAVL